MKWQILALGALVALGIIAPIFLLPSFLLHKPNAKLPKFGDVSITTATDKAQERALWGMTGQEYGAQTFTPSVTGTIGSIQDATRIALGAPSDQVFIEIQTTSAGLPTGTVVGTSNNQTITGNTCSSGMSLFTYTFASPPSVTSGTVYAIVLKRTGAFDAANNYSDCGTDVDTYAGGNAVYYDGTWHAQASDRYDTFTVVTASAQPPPNNDQSAWFMVL